MTGQRNIAITPEGWAEATAQMKAATAANPQLAAMAKAFEPTKAELEQIAEAERLVEDAKASHAAAVIALNRAEQGIKSPPSGFEFFKKSKQAHRAAVASASRPGLRADVEESRGSLQSAIRRLNDTVRTIERDRFARRHEAKLKHAPVLPPARLHGNPYAPKEAA